MKNIILVLFILLMNRNAFAQDFKVLNNESLIREHKIKSISVRFIDNGYYEGEDSIGVGKAEFDNSGKVLYLKYFYLFDVMLYSEEFRFTYDTLGRLIEKINIHTDYPKTKEEVKLVGGNNSRTAKWTYGYDKRGNLIVEYEYLNATDSKPILSSVYEYDANDNKIKATFQNLRFPKQESEANRIEVYEYDKNNKLVKIKTNLVNTNTDYVVMYKYNSEGRGTFKSFIYNDGSGYFSKYSYENGMLSGEEVYTVGEKGWVNKTIFEYSKNGCPIKETFKNRFGYESQNTFECSEKGLLKREYWYSEEGKVTCYFETEYTYY